MNNTWRSKDSRIALADQIMAELDMFVDPPAPASVLETEDLPEMAREDQAERRHKDKKEKERRKRDGLEEDEEERRRRKKRHKEKKRQREEAKAGRVNEEGESTVTDKDGPAEELEPGEIESPSHAAGKPLKGSSLADSIPRVGSSSLLPLADCLKESVDTWVKEKNPKLLNGKHLVHDLDAPETGMQMLASAYGEDRAESEREQKRGSQEKTDREKARRGEDDARDGERKRHQSRERSRDDAAREKDKKDRRERERSKAQHSRKTEEDSPDRRSVRSKSKESHRSRDRSLDRRRRSRSRDSTYERRRNRSRSQDSARQPPPPPPRRRDLSIERSHRSSSARRDSRDPSYRRSDRDRQADYRSRRSESRSRREDSRAPSSRVDPEEELRKKVEEEQKRSGIQNPGLARCILIRR